MPVTKPSPLSKSGKGFTTAKSSAHNQNERVTAQHVLDYMNSNQQYIETASSFMETIAMNTGIVAQAMKDIRDKYLNSNQN